MPNFQYGNTTIEYELIYQPEKEDISITVQWLSGVKVTAPTNIDDQQLHSALYKKAPWILKKWNEFNEIEDLPVPKEFVSGEKFPYLGRHYRLKVYTNEMIENPNLQFKHGRFISEVPVDLPIIEKNEKLTHLFTDWYITHGTKKIGERLSIYVPKMGVEPTKIVLKEQKVRWGTCTQKGIIYLNWRIMMAPMAIVDYLLVHELAHLKYPNHSTEYWNFVRSIIPDYEHQKEWLRLNGPTLTL